MLWERYLKTFSKRGDPTDDDRVAIVACRLSHILFISYYWKNGALLTALAKRWHSEHNTFHLSTREIIVTPKDVYQILHIPITAKLVTYDVEKHGGTEEL